MNFLTTDRWVLTALATRLLMPPLRPRLFQAFLTTLAAPRAAARPAYRAAAPSIFFHTIYSGAEVTPLQMRFNKCYTHRKEHHDERKKLNRDRYWRAQRAIEALLDYDGRKRLRVQEPTAWVTRYGERRFISKRGRGHFPNPNIIYVRTAKTYGPDPLIGPHNA